MSIDSKTGTSKSMHDNDRAEMSHKRRCGQLRLRSQRKKRNSFGLLEERRVVHIIPGALLRYPGINMSRSIVPI